MAKLYKRWDKRVRIGQEHCRDTDIYRWFLGSTLTYDATGHKLYIACIESYNSPDGPFNLEIWNLADEDWDVVGTFPTLKQAKTMGRFMAGLATTGSS
jgi:hypothetical protein